MKRKLLTALVAGGALGWGGAANAVVFDFQDGNVIDVGTLDWQQTSLAVEDGTQAILDFVSSGGTCTGTTTNCQFTFYTHARLVAVNDVSGALVTPTGLNTDYEITLTMAVNETVTTLVGTPGVDAVAFFATAPNTGEELEMWYDTTLDTNDVAGYGFNNGTLILTGDEVNATTGLFSITSDVPVQLDQAPGAVPGPATDDYGVGNGVPGQSQLTIEGIGTNQNLAWDQLVQDNTFFLEQLDTFGISFENISVGLPFGTVDPSDCFTDAASGVVVGASQAVGHQCANVHVDALYLFNPDGTGFVPTVGNVNGAPLGAGGDVDFVAQTDFNSTLNPEPVPEPTTIALVGLGLLGIGAARRRRRA